MLLGGRADQALRWSEEVVDSVVRRAGSWHIGGKDRTADRLSLVRCTLPAPRLPPAPSYGWVDLAEGSSQALGVCVGAGGKGGREERLSSRDGRSSVLAEGGVEGDARSG